MASLEIKKLAKDALQRIREAGLETITAIQLQQFLEVGDTTTHKIFDIFSETWKIGDKPGSLIVPPMKENQQPNGKLKPSKVDPKRLRMLRDQAIEKALEDYLAGDADSRDLAAALRMIPVDPPAPPPPEKGRQLSPEDLGLVAQAYLDIMQQRGNNEE